MIKTNSLGNGVPKEKIHYTSIACITIDFAMRMDRKHFLQVYLEEYKYKTKEIQMSRFINTEVDLESDSASDTDLDSEWNDELMAKLKSDNDSNNDSE